MLFKIEGVLFFFSFCAAVPGRPSPRPTAAATSAAATLAQPSPLPNTPPAAAPKQCLRRRRRRRRSNPFSRRPNPRAATNPRAGTWG
jgi:hypothetical protein